MRVLFDWQAGDGKGQWETIAKIERRTTPKIPRWTWGALLALAVTLALGGAIGLRRRHDATLDRIAFHIQSVIDLETQALAQHDIDLFLAQQDSMAPGWVAWQAKHLPRDLRRLNSTLSDGCTDALPQVSRTGCPINGPAEVQGVELRGDTAWVEVIASQTPVRQARFYRKTDLGWVHTAPRVEFWGEPVQAQYGEVLVQCHERDLPQVEPTVEQVRSVLNDLCVTLDCPSDRTLKVDLAVGVRADELYAFAQDTLTLPSPWLTGTPIEGKWDKEHLDELTYWVAYAVISDFLRPADEGDLNPLQQALAAEYAAWYSYQDNTVAPLLRRVIERNGAEVLPDLLWALREQVSLSWLLGEWLALSPSDDKVGYFGTLLNLEREAILAERKDTLLLLQDSDPTWMGIQAKDYDRIQSGELCFCAAPAQIQRLEMDGDHAVVWLKEWVSIEHEGESPRSIPRVAFFRREAGNWKRTWRYPSSAQLTQVLPPSADGSVISEGEGR